MKKKGRTIKYYVRNDLMKVSYENEIELLPNIGDVIHADGYIIKVEEIVHYDKFNEIIIYCFGLGKE